jgi:hypothetical protein
VIELPIAQRDEHHLVLLFHQIANDLLQLVASDVLGVGRLDRLENAPAIHEKVRDDMGMPHPGVFGLYMEQPTPMFDVVIEAEERRLRHARHRIRRGGVSFLARSFSLRRAVSSLRAGEIRATPE